MLQLQNVKAITVRWIKDGSVRGYPGSQQRIPFLTLLLYVFFRYQTSNMSFCCSYCQTYRQITRKLSYLWGPLWYLWADGMGSSIWGSFNGLSKPLSQKSCWPLRSLRNFLRGKKPISCPLILPWIQTDWSPSSHVSLFMCFWDYPFWLLSWQHQTFYMLVL